MKCPKCGANMVEKPPEFYYTSNPVQWDAYEWCACGHTEYLGRKRGKTVEEALLEDWKKANPDRA